MTCLAHQAEELLVPPSTVARSDRHGARVMMRMGHRTPGRRAWPRAQAEAIDLGALLRPLARRERLLTAQEEARARCEILLMRKRSRRRALLSGLMSALDLGGLGSACWEGAWERGPTPGTLPAGALTLSRLLCPPPEGAWTAVGNELRAGMRVAAQEHGVPDDDPVFEMIGMPGLLPPAGALTRLKEMWPGSEGRAVEAAGSIGEAMRAQSIRLLQAA